MTDEIDRWLSDEGLTPPPDFINQVTALSRAIPQRRIGRVWVRAWQWASLSASAGLGALLLSEFIFFAFTSAHAL
jgi:hypothetical protein